MTTITDTNSSYTTPITSGTTVIVNGTGTLATTIQNGGSAVVSSGGAEQGTTIQNGGALLVSSGGTDTGTIIQFGGTETVSSGTATLDQIAGALVITGSTTVSNETVLGGGSLVLASGKAGVTGTLTFSGLNADVVISSTPSSASNVGDGAVMTGFVGGDIIQLVTVTGAAALNTSPSGTLTLATLTGGATTETFTFANVNSVQLVTLATGDEILANTQVVSTSSTDLAVAAGNGVFVTAAGTVANTQVQSGGVLTVYGIASNTTLAAGGTEIINNGGVASNTTLAAGGTEIINSGGTDTSAVISSGATQTLSGGSATGAAIYGTQNIVVAAAVSNETIYNGGTLDLYIKNATATGIIVENGGALNISGAATASSVIINGGSVVLQSPKAELSGGLTFTGAGTLIEAAIISASTITGDQAVISGFGSGDVIELMSFSTGTSLSTTSSTLTSTETLTVTSGATAETFTFAGTNLTFGMTAITGGEAITLAATGTTTAAPTISLNITGNTDIANIGTGAIITGLTTTNGTEVMTITGGSSMGNTVEIVTFAGTGEYFDLAADSAGTGASLTVIDQLTSFTAGDLVLGVIGNDNDSAAYGDNQAAPIVLEEIDPTTGKIIGEMVLPQTTTVANGVTEYGISGEYGSSSEGILQLSADGKSLVIAGYGVNAAAYNAAEAAGGANNYGTGALAQTSSLTDGTLTAVARVIADISASGTIDTSTALYNIFNTNNPRSVATVNGQVFYIAGQGTGTDTTQGVFVANDGASAATAIDTTTDMRDVEIYDGHLYVSTDTKQGGTLAMVAEFNTSTLPTSTTAPTELNGFSSTITLTAAEENTVNASAVGTVVALAPEQYFFANATTLYVADGGNPKGGTIGDGGLQKWLLNTTTGVWSLAYTLSDGLNLSATTGTSGLIGLTGKLNADGTVTFYATNATYGDLDQTYVYTITDTVSATTAAGESFTVLTAAETGTNVRGIAEAPSNPTSATIGSGVTSAGLTISAGSNVTIAAGGTLSGAVINSGGIAYDFGTDSGSLIAADGTETVYTGGTATAGNVYGAQIVSGAVSNETVYYDGLLSVAAGGTATAITLAVSAGLDIAGSVSNLVMSGGIADLSAATATLSGLTFAGAADVVVLDNSAAIQGAITGFTAADEIDFLSIGSGAALTSSIVGATTVETITSGSVTQTITLAGSFAAGALSLVADGNGGEALLLTNGEVFGTREITNGNSATAVTVASGGTLQVDAGATVSGDLILAGGTELISGTASGDNIAGSATLASGASASNETVTGTLLIDAGATLGGTLTAGSTAIVSLASGATLGALISGFTLGSEITGLGAATTVTGMTSGGNTIEAVTGGGVSEAFTFSGTGYGLFSVTNGTLSESSIISVASGVTSANVTVGNGITLDVLAGGTDSNAVILSGGTVVLAVGATETNATIQNGGTEILLGSVNVTGDLVYGTQEENVSIAGTAVLSGETIFSGGAVELMSRTYILENSTILSGGILAITGNATGQNLTLAGGTIDLGSPKSNIMGSLDFESGTLEITDIISAGSAYGEDATIANFGAGDVIEFTALGSVTQASSITNGSITTLGYLGSADTKGYVQYLTFANTTAFDLVTLAGGTVELLTPASSVSSGTVTQTGGTTSGTTVASGATLVISGGTESGGTVSGGTEVVSSGGASSNTAITNGGSQIVANGGTVTGTTLTQDSTQTLQSGASASGVTVGDPSAQIVSAGASATNTTLTAGGEQDVYGTATGTTIENGSIEFVYTGGTSADSLIESGGTLVLGGGTETHTTLQNGGTIINDKIAFTAGMTGTITGGELVVSDAGGTVFSLALDGSYTGDAVHVTQAADGNTELTLCFYPGTAIATPAGETPVEALREGDLVLTANGALPVRWIGQSHIATRFADKQRTLPVRITAGALGHNLPVRDLLLSPDHAVFIGGILAHAGALVNNVTILHETSLPEQFTYYHVELATHELLLAEGVQAESFVDNADRMNFHNWQDRAEPAAPIAEMPYPRAKSQRQLPTPVRQLLAVARQA